GIAYSNRIRGERADNLELAIATLEQSLEVYTREAFPEQWAMTQNNLGLAYSDRIRGERADNLELAIAALNLSLEVLTRPAFPEQWARSQHNLGVAYRTRIRGKRAENLELAIAALNLSLEVYTREAFPEQWASTQTSLGTAYGDRIRGERAENLESAIAALNLSLEIYTRDAFPEDWAGTQTSLGNAYSDRIREDRAENLELAIDAYNLSLEVYTREAFPEGWAMTQNNLGNAYRNRIRGERAENLELAIAALKQSLEVYTREAFPKDWARSQTNLGTAYLYRIRGKRADNLELAIATSKLSLEVLTREAFPEQWAMTQTNLGIAYSDRIRGNRANNLEFAIDAYNLSLEVYTREAFPEYWARSQNNLGNAYRDRIREDRADNLELAIAALTQSLGVYTREAFPEQWAMTQTNLGIAYSDRIRGNRANNLEFTIDAYNLSLGVYTREAFPYEWAMTQNSLGNAYRDRIKEDRAENLELAIAALKQSLEVCTREAFPEQWAMTQNNLGIAYSDRIRGERADNLELAIAALKQSLEVYTREAFPKDWARSQSNLGTAYRDRCLYRIREWKADNLQEAIAAYNLSLEVYTPKAFPRDCLRTGGNLGKAANLIQDWKTAIKGYNLAIEAVENTRLEALNPQRQQEILSEAMDVYHGIVQSYLNLKQPDKALEYVERSKTRYLVQLFTERDIYPKGNVPQAIITELDRLRRAILGEEQQLAKQEQTRNRGEILTLNKQRQPILIDYTHLNQLKQELNQLIDREITPIDPNFSLTEKVETISFEDIKSLTNDSTSLLQWYITAKKILAFVVSANEIVKVWQSSEEDRNKLFDTLNNYLQLYYSETGKQEWINQLSNLLQTFADTLHINEIISLIPETCQRLIIIPHWFLHILPIHALPIDNNCILQDKYDIQYAPSCQILQITKQRPLNQLTNLFAIQNPTKDLTFTDLEVNIISTLFNQKEIIAKDNATKNTVTTQLKASESHCYHFSCHGRFNPNNPLESALLLANTNKLTLGKIFELDLKKARLVVLSACETGLIDLNSISDEYIGLPAGFLFAGSSSVISSLWAVSDLSTSFLMMKFYEIVLDETQDFSIPAALKIAQNWLRNLTVEEYSVELDNCQKLIEQIKYKLTLDEFRKLIDKKVIDWIEDEKYRIEGIDPNEQLFNNPFYWTAFTAAGI
nr:tetratricopeptide repeat protein [Crocosphaera sp.]